MAVGPRGWGGGGVMGKKNRGLSAINVLGPKRSCFNSFNYRASVSATLAK